MTTISAVPPVRSEQLRAERLAVMKRRAGLLLGAVTAVWLGVTILGRGGAGGAWTGYVQATAEAAMVGGLADWFAVTALFRHPLGLPIPHTAIVVERKDQFAATLGEFIQESFLTPDVLVERVRGADVVPRLAAWLSEPANAARVADEVTDGAVTIADLINDDEVHRTLEGVVRDRLDTVTLAPLAGKGLEFLIKDGRHQQVLDTALRELDRYLAEHRGELQQRLGQKSPWWLPGAAEDRIFDRLVAGARTLIAEMLEDRDHHLRRRFDDRVVQLAADLQHDPSMIERGERLKAEVLAQPQLQDWVAAMWRDAKEVLRTQSADPDSELRRRLAGVVVSTGTHLREDPGLSAKAEDAVEQGVIYVADRFNGEIRDLVAGTIGRWDAEETARRLELLLGPDLQYIRINGTVVGAAAGLVLYSIAQAVG